MPPFPGRTIHFAKFNVTSQVKSTFLFAPLPRLTSCHVNIKPLLPGHILVCPLQVKPRLVDLTRDEVSDLFNTVARIQRTLTRVYKTDAFNVAVQDGEAAGQSVPHVHCHVIPRQHGDPGSDDKVHEWLEGEEGDVGKAQKEAGQGEEKSDAVRKHDEWMKDEERKPRTKEEMDQDARWLREEMAKDDEGSGKL
ncbi:Dinucleoside triphosphate hydrolase [Vermiconidia calcicola]|uniref:Dinucleoside triphosphate hydrolase n=1 Tax=Vermiconidia calcicola TaxID=1690605 RepID=A0ACC3MRB8_9PEZI|nr:Dinucleoside triphosphate hydrolase [Vermiconidia calcicola]